MVSKSNFSATSKKDDLPQEPLSNYYNFRKKIIFKKLDIETNEDSLLQFLKNSQIIVNDKSKNSIKGGFFQSLPINIYSLSISVKENIANYCLIFALYFEKKAFIKALKLFLFMCDQNKDSLIYLTSKIVEQLPKISNTNKIAKFYPTITKTMLQLLSIFIKLSGKFNKSSLEDFYITLYYKIVHVLSTTVIKYNPSSSDEIKNQLKNERRYFYSSCLFDSSIYLFNRFQPLSASIYILQHILDLYGNKLTFVPNEIESILLLKVNYNLGLFYYIDGYYNESINNFNQARERLLDIKYFPTTPLKKINISDKLLKSLNNNSSNNLYNFNEYLDMFNRNAKYSRNNIKRTSIGQYSNPSREKNMEDKKSLIAKIKEKNLRTQREYELITNLKIRKFKQLSTIFLGASSLLYLNSPILLEEVKEKILIEIELYLSEIELNHKNYRESLNHINLILALQSIDINENSGNSFGILNLRQSQKLCKSRTMLNMTKNSTSSNGINECDENKIMDNKLKFSLKNGQSSESNILLLNKKKNENNFNNILSKFKTIKYHLTNIDKNRIMLILEQIECENNTSPNNLSDKMMEIKYRRNMAKKNSLLNKERKIITSKEMEKFFLFICGLSIYQLKILNESQPEPSLRRNDLPIIFNNQFQDCLTNAQRLSLSFLETMSLSRYIILKDTNKDIAPENLDFRFMKYRIKDAEPEEENSYKIKNKIYWLDNHKGKRRSSDSNMSSNTQNNLFSSKNCLSSTKFNEKEIECINFDLLLNSLKNEENKSFVIMHKQSILKLLNQISKEELKVFIKSPQLLNKLITNISLKSEIKENGGNNINELYFHEK